MTTPKNSMELVGTAVLVFTIQTSICNGSSLTPLAIGTILMSIVFAGGPISGAHYNPAVSFAVTLRGGGLTWSEMTSYWIAQIIGGFIGALIGGFISPTSVVVSMGSDATMAQAIISEVMYTFVLCLVVLCVATNSKVENNHYYGLAIGLVVLAGAITVGPISGGAFNPAVAFGLSVAGGFANFGYSVVVSVANLVGGAVAAVLFRVVLPEEFGLARGGTVGETTPFNA
mmetsp:Transcript_8060/g.16760  ORF Transcript_8060/g.16760 Transcript_8060/m.16760 type:complete len:229 (-) Transcript_8060:260-946(-)